MKPTLTWNRCVGALEIPKLEVSQKRAHRRRVSAGKKGQCTNHPLSTISSIPYPKSQQHSDTEVHHSYLPHCQGWTTMTPPQLATRDLHVPLLSGPNMGSNNTHAGHSLSVSPPTESAKPSLPHDHQCTQSRTLPTRDRPPSRPAIGIAIRNTIGEHIKPAAEALPKADFHNRRSSTDGDHIALDTTESDDAEAVGQSLVRLARARTCRTACHALLFFLPEFPKAPTPCTNLTKSKTTTIQVELRIRIPRISRLRRLMVLWEEERSHQSPPRDRR